MINTTFLVRCPDNTALVLQRINDQVFPDPERIMDNLRQVLPLFAGEAGGLRMPALIPAQSGDSLVRDRHGQAWRLMTYIDASCTLQSLSDEDQARQVGLALAAFHRAVAALDPGRLHDTLPGFHVTPDYLAAYDKLPEAGADSDDERRCRDIIEQGRARAPVLQQAQASGRLRQHVTHGDPKLNNFLFDAARRQVISLIDLDTVKPGLLHHDIADCIRSCCNEAGEQEPPRFNADWARALLRAWLRGVGGLLAEHERALLTDAIVLLPWELGLRFFTDHLQGDCYFRVAHRGQNLARAGCQFALFQEMLRHEARIRDWISRG